MKNNNNNNKYSSSVTDVPEKHKFKVSYCSSSSDNCSNEQQSSEKHKFKVSYYDAQGNLRQRYITASNERDALVDAWLNNKNVIEPVSVQRI